MSSGRAVPGSSILETRRTISSTRSPAVSVTGPDIDIAEGEAQPIQTPPTTPAPTASGRSVARVQDQRSDLVTEQGRTSISDAVVAKIAGLACREVSGVHDMGTGATRAFGVIKEKLPIGGVQASAAQGVTVEVGARQAAVDVDIVVEYGAAIVDVAESIRRNVIAKVEAMTGLEVTEVNVMVDDVFLGETGNEEPRVR
jgi:uncharacterized alkaline shock family protein YloU